MKWYDKPKAEMPVAILYDDAEWEQMSLIYNIAIVTLIAQDCNPVPITDMIECYETR